MFLFLLVLCRGSVSGEIGPRRFHQSRPRWSHCCHPFHMRKRKRNIIRSFFTIPFFIGRILSLRQFKHTLFFTQTGRGRKKEEGKAISSSIFSLPPLFFQGRLLRNFLSLSLSLSLSSFYITVAIATDLEEEGEKEKKNSGGGGVEMDFFSFLSLRTRDGRESARGSADRALQPSKDSFTLNTFDSPFKPDPNWKPFYLTIPLPLFCLTRVMNTKIKTTPTFRS